MNWWELFRAGLQTSAERAYLLGRLSFDYVRDLIARRGLDQRYAHPSTVRAFTSQVQRAVETGMELTAGRFVGVMEHGQNPTQQFGYHYGVIVRIDNPDDFSRQVSIPWRIDSDKPLNKQEINRRVAMDLADWKAERPTLPGDMAESWIQKDMRAIFWRDKWIDRGELPPWEVEVISAYRRD